MCRHFFTIRSLAFLIICTRKRLTYLFPTRPWQRSGWNSFSKHSMELFPRGRKTVDEAKPKGGASAPKVSNSKSPAARPKAGAAAPLRTDGGLFGVAVVKKRATGAAAAGGAAGGASKKAKGTSLGEAMSAAGMGGGEEGEDCGGLLKVVPHPSGKGKAERIEVPQFKKLAAGTLLLGLVKRVTRRQVFVALPYGLSGLVSVGEVSDFRLFADGGGEEEDDDEDNKAADDEEEEDDIEDDDEEVVAAPGAAAAEVAKAKAGGKSSSLEALFVVGQAVRCVVVGTSTTKHGKKSVALSLKPSVVNRGLFLEHLGAGVGVYGAVASVEDHGYVVSLGVDGVSGFLKKVDCDPRLLRGSGRAPGLGSGSGGGRLRVGQPLDLCVVSVAVDARAVQVTNQPELVGAARVDGPPLDHRGKRPAGVPLLNGGAALPVRALKPGGLVSARVVKVVDNGLVVAINLLGGAKPLVGVVEQVCGLIHPL